jgi:hypothetical protein
LSKIYKSICLNIDDIVETFEDEPDTFVEYFFENGDQNKIRTVCSSLGKAVARLFPQEYGAVLQKILYILFF